MTMSRTLCLLTSGLVSLVLASACASQAEGSGFTNVLDASSDGPGGSYCPNQGSAIGCLLSPGVCGLNYGMGCVSKGTTYGP